LVWSPKLRTNLQWKPFHKMELHKWKKPSGVFSYTPRMISVLVKSTFDLIIHKILGGFCDLFHFLSTCPKWTSHLSCTQPIETPNLPTSQFGFEWKSEYEKFGVQLVEHPSQKSFSLKRFEPFNFQTLLNHY
jgi:hypothetical protein